MRNLSAGLRVISRHARNAGADPRRWLWIVRRIGGILREGRLSAVLERHALVADLYADYPEWIDRYDRLDDARRAELRALAGRLRWRPLISVLLPTYESSLAELRAAVESVRAQLYPHWELCIVDDGSRSSDIRGYLSQLRTDPKIRIRENARNEGISAALNAALAMARGDFVAFLDHDDLLHEAALLRVAEAIDARPDAQLVYTDEDMLDEHGRRHSPHFKPDWNEEWIRTSNYVLHLCVARTEAARAVGGFAPRHDGVQDWDFLLRIAEASGTERIVHVPHVLYHWRVRPGSTAAGVNQKHGIEAAQRRVVEDMLARRGLAGTVTRSSTGLRIRYRICDPPLVSIVIPTKDAATLLDRCIKSIRSRTDYPAVEVIVVDHESREPDALALLADLRRSSDVRVVPYTGPFNYAAECNLGVEHARGEVVVLLNNDVEVRDGDWLATLVGHALQADVGVVGALLLYPDDTIQHAGVVLGLNGTADRPYLGYRCGHTGIAGRAAAARDVTAVVTACAAVRRDVYLEAGGMDESLAVSHNDLDFCLRVRERGYRNVLDPAVVLRHREGASRGLENSPADRARADDEAARFRARWGAVIADDPCYNPNLTLTGAAFALAWPPRRREPSMPSTIDYSSGCRLPAREWADFNRRVIFDEPALQTLAAPFPPRSLMQNVSGLEAERDFAAHGAHFWEAFSQILPRPLSSYSPILDFGCGCGRLARLFKGHPGEVHGCDIDPRHVQWVRGHLPFVTAVATQPNQPLPYADDSFELVIAISVFTHLTEASQDLMLAELRRIARPGGTLLLTTHGERALQRAREEERIYRMIAVDDARFARAQEDFAANRHAFVPQEGHLTSATFQYGITFLSSPYVHSHWGHDLHVQDIVSGGLHDFQDIVVLRKPG
jgi:glycosyltransferase involved in cell wall biosynthesis/SAM-dependent methyltransferase